MPQQEKITKKLDFRKSAEITGFRIIPTKVANYTVLNTDSGAYLTATSANESHVIWFTLPAYAQANGCVWHFLTINTGPIQIISGGSNGFVSRYGTNTVGVNIGCLQAPGQGIKVVCDGSKYYLADSNPFGGSLQANVGYLQS